MDAANEGRLPGGELRCSVVVPVHNDGAMAVHCLDALARQTVAPDRFEVLIVDAASTDASAQLVADWLARANLPTWQLVKSESPNLAVARNAGARQASAALLLFTDADCTPSCRLG